MPLHTWVRGVGREPETPCDLFSVTYSLPSPAALRAEVAGAYALGEVVDCRLLRSYANDVYEVTTTGGRYILKVYGAVRRSWSDVAYELEVLERLAAGGVAVAPAMARRDGCLIGVLRMPEGVRCYVLYAYADGAKPVRPFTDALYYRFGEASARMHRALDGFASTHQREPIDLTYLLDRPLAALRPHLTHRPDDWDFLTRLADTVHVGITALASRLDWGVCHGDLSLDNVHVTDGDDIIFYDFDSGGPGWRACDPYGVYWYSVEGRHGFWDAFLTGYREVRPFGAADLAAVPFFVGAIWLWNAGTAVTRLAARVGTWRLTDDYFDEQIGLLRRWDDGGPLTTVE